MTKKTHMRLKHVNKVLYLLSIAMLTSGAILSFITTPVAADSGRIWTTTGCGSAAQNAHHYVVGDHIFINFEGMPAGTRTWEIRYTNKAGKPLVSLASNPLIHTVMRFGVQLSSTRLGRGEGRTPGEACQGSR